LQQFYFSYQNPPAPGTITLATSTTPSQDYPEGGAVTLEWGTANGANSYKVYWGESSGVYKTASSVGSTDHTIISGLKNDTTYYFSVTALTDDMAESSYYPEKKAIPRDLVAPVDSPSFIVASTTVRATEISLAWTAITDADSYEISYGLSAGQYGMEINMGNDTEVLIRELTPGVEYFFGIRALDAAGNKSGYGITQATTLPE
jgi:Fibronectin type III domain